MKRIVLLLLFSLCLASFPNWSRADLLYNVENPPPPEMPNLSTRVSGITTISGWAFDTRPAVHIASVQLLIDGQPADEISCCSAREDVQQAFPQYPPENTLKSAWSLLTNWANLSASNHTLRVVIRNTVGEDVHIDRPITVVKLGQTSFVDIVDLSSATCRVEGQAVVLNGVSVHEKDFSQQSTGQIQQQWIPGLQSFGIVSVARQSVQGGIIPFPPEVAAIIVKLSVPTGLHLYLDPDPSHFAVIGQGCPEGRAPGFYERDAVEVVLYAQWSQCYGGTYGEMLYWVTHEVCHAHQHRVILNAGLPFGTGISGLETYLETPEGQAFMAAGGKISVPWNSSVSPIEDNANGTF